MTSVDPIRTGAPCPIVDYVKTTPPGPVGAMFATMDGYQDLARPFVRTEEAYGYWIFTDHDVIHDGLRRVDLWSSCVVDPTDPEPPYRWIPIMLDRPEHPKWRTLLNSYFSPARVRGLRAGQSRMAAGLVEGLLPAGECDFIRDVGQVFPSQVFVQLMGMPQSMLPQFMEWEHMILHGSVETDPDRKIQQAGNEALTAYFAELIAERRANPDPTADDIVTAALTWELDGEPIDDADLLNCLIFLTIAGLDTVAAQSSWAMYHLATHPVDRTRIVDEPDLIPHAVEELMRAYPVIQTARKATRDAEFHGCPVKAGDMALFPMSASGRDNKERPDARRVDLDRTDVRHLGFGGGPHRCLGSHLARQELAVLLEEWHRVVPEYDLAEEPLEHSGTGVWGLESLRLSWTGSVSG